MKIGEKKKTLFLKALLIVILSGVICDFATGQEKYIVTATKLNVRKTSSAQSTALGGLSKGDTINVHSIKNSWAEIDFKQGRGFVFVKYIEPVMVEETKELDIEPNSGEISIPITVEPVYAKDSNSFLNQMHFRLTSTLSLGLSNFYSFDAYSHPRFGFGLDMGIQLSADFMPKNMFSELTLGYMSLGNSNYSFPSFTVNVLPVGYRSDTFDLWVLQNASYYAIGGLSFQFSWGGIDFYRNSNYYSFSSKPTINLYFKGGVEITDMTAVGIIYMHGIDNVCSNLPIGIKHSVILVYGSFLFDKWIEQ